MQISSQKVATFHYTLTNDDDEVLDLLGDDEQIVCALEGCEFPFLPEQGAGDQFMAAIAAAQAYGERDEELVQTLGKESFAEIEDLRVGLQLEASGDDDESRIVTVVAVEGDRVTVDGNHPLAGRTLHFDVEIVAVRAATEEEIRLSALVADADPGTQSEESDDVDGNDGEVEGLERFVDVHGVQLRFERAYGRSESRVYLQPQSWSTHSLAFNPHFPSFHRTTLTQKWTQTWTAP